MYVYTPAMKRNGCRPTKVIHDTGNMKMRPGIHDDYKIAILANPPIYSYTHTYVYIYICTNIFKYIVMNRWDNTNSNTSSN